MIACTNCHNQLVFVSSMKKWTTANPPQEAFTCITGGDHVPKEPRPCQAEAHA